MPVRPEDLDERLQAETWDRLAGPPDGRRWIRIPLRRVRVRDDAAPDVRATTIFSRTKALLGDDVPAAGESFMAWGTMTMDDEVRITAEVRSDHVEVLVPCRSTEGETCDVVRPFQSEGFTDKESPRALAVVLPGVVSVRQRDEEPAIIHADPRAAVHEVLRHEDPASALLEEPRRCRGPVAPLIAVRSDGPRQLAVFHTYAEDDRAHGSPPPCCGKARLKLTHAFAETRDLRIRISPVPPQLSRFETPSVRGTTIRVVTERDDIRVVRIHAFLAVHADCHGSPPFS
jgi:hypothetical protein